MQQWIKSHGRASGTSALVKGFKKPSGFPFDWFNDCLVILKSMWLTFTLAFCKLILDWKRPSLDLKKRKERHYVDPVLHNWAILLLIHLKLFVPRHFITTLQFCLSLTTDRKRYQIWPQSGNINQVIYMDCDIRNAGLIRWIDSFMRMFVWIPLTHAFKIVICVSLDVCLHMFFTHLWWLTSAFVSTKIKYICSHFKAFWCCYINRILLMGVCVFILRLLSEMYAVHIIVTQSAVPIYSLTDRRYC